MQKNYEGQHIFVSISIVVAISSPLFLMFVPIAIANNVYYTAETWFVFLSPSVYWVYGVGFLLLFVAVLLPAIFRVRKFPILLSIISVALSVFVFYTAILHYQSLSETNITYKPLFSKTVHTYSWHDVSKVIHQANTSGNTSTYEFIFRDGNKLTISENGYFNDIKLQLLDKLRKLDISIQYINN